MLLWPPCSSVWPPPTLAPSPHPPHPYSLSRVESSLPTQTDSCTNSLHCKKLNHTVFLFLWVFFFSSTHLCVFKFDRYKHCSKCYEKKCTLGFLCVFLYKAGRSGLLRLPAFVPSPPLLPPPPPPFPSPPVFIHSSSSLPLALTSSPLHAQDGQTRGSSDQSRLALK